ncbi:protocadherin Fat 1-like [Mya arenaria]|uniref:protocadherin Fat 1-like n=1 Tax=Mya arenaria TaxID=6604 RepID=UPI0022E6C868|nr:protocadherin Fat 1-like [Mya arenaria]
MAYEINGIPYKADDSCWDGTNAVDYTGTISVTSSGLTCQPWAQDSPHPHAYHAGAPNFPNDGYSDVTASNYCRDPDGAAGTGGPWCYTMDPGTEAEYCSIPLCPNPVCVTDSVVGQSDPSTVINSVETYVGNQYMQTDPSYTVACCGTVQEWRFHQRSWYGIIRFQVWRADTSNPGHYRLIGENAFSYVYTQIDMTHYTSVDQADQINVQDGDYIGWWYTESYDMVAYQSPGTANNILWLQPGAATAVGATLDFSVGFAHQGRDYAIGAVLAASLSPRFTNTLTTLTLSVNEAVGNTVYTVTYTDDDVGDVSSLAVTMDTNTYFDFTAPDVTVKTTLVAGTYTLRFTVTDRCDATGALIVAVNVLPEAVTISSLPTTESVSESVTSETLVHELVFSPAGSYTCTLDAYSPTRTEGNPFVVQDTPTPGVGVYLLAGANIRYAVSPSYNVTVTCTEASTATATSYLIVSVDPNTAPVFSNFQASTTFSATTPVNTVVYTATITDTDPVSVTLACDPAGSPFAVNNDGEVYVTSDLEANNVAAYTCFLTADDSFTTVTSSNISMTITGLNVAPTITNLDDAVSILENQPAGASVFHVSSSDVNGDTPTFSASFAVPACGAMYTISPTDGSVTTLVTLDFETDPSCIAVVKVFDGHVTSLPGTLTIDVTDVDEPPVWSSAGYIITTQEVASGTVLGGPTIIATDPEATAVTYSLNCGADSGYLSINPTSGAVTMAAAFDLEAASVDTYTISCTVTGTDATAQTSTSPLSVTVTDANDVAPVFSSAVYPIYINEEYGLVGAVE